MIIDSFIINSLLDYPGNIACTIFTGGCNYNCWYCHNKALIKNTKNKVDEEELLGALKERAGFLDGVVICGGEPTLQADLAEFIKKIKSLGLKVKLDTNGTNPQVIRELLNLELLDYIAMDIKAPFDRYEAVTGCKVNTAKLKESIDLIKNSGLEHEFRTTFSPDLDITDIVSVARMIAGARAYYIQQYERPLQEERRPHAGKILDEAVIAANEFVPAHRRG